MTASSVSNSSVVLPAPLVRVTGGQHTESGAFGETWTVLDRVEVALADYSDSLEDVRIELLRRRKRAKSGLRSYRWVHPSDHTGQTNVLDGGRSRGGNHFDSNGASMESRQTSFPVIGEYDWTEVQLGAWWKQGRVLISGDNFLDVPVSTGDNTDDRYDLGPSHLPQWKGIGGSTTQRFAFRASAVDPDGEDDRDRLTGPVSVDVIIMKPVIPGTRGLFVWPDGSGDSVGVDTDQLAVWMDHIR